jgi:ParB family chromosome partitioning protein
MSAIFLHLQVDRGIMVNNRSHTKLPKISFLPREVLVPSTVQPRCYFDEEAIIELAQSIENHGVLQPLIVMKVDNNKYEIVAGERRYRAANIVGLKKLPCLVMNLQQNDALAVALVENIQRQDLNPIEEAKAYFRLKDTLKINQEDVAKIVGKDRATVANTMRLLKLPELVQDFVVNGELSMGHAKALLAMASQDMQSMVAKKIIREGLSVRQAEKIIKVIKSGYTVSESKKMFYSDPKHLLMEKELQKKLEQFFGLKVSIKKENSGYSLVIHMDSELQVNHFLDLLAIEI